MVLTPTVNTNWELITGKNLTRQSALTSRIKEAYICIALDCCSAYPACAAGYTVDLSADGRITTIISATAEDLEVGACCCTLLVTKYEPSACNVASTGTLHLFETASSALMCCATVAAPLGELPDCATDAQCKTLKFHIIGF